MVTLSVVVPAHNEEKFIGRTLDALVRSTHKPYELIVVCDRCTDQTRKVAQKYTDNVIDIDSTNVSVARNKGAGIASGEVLVFCDADTLVESDYLEKIVHAIEQGADYGTGTWMSESGNLMPRIMTFGANVLHRAYKTFGGNCFVRKELFVRMGGYDETLSRGEDNVLGLSLARVNANYAFLKSAKYTPSERKYKKIGWRHHAGTIRDAILYFVSPKKHRERYGVPSKNKR